MTWDKEARLTIIAPDMRALFAAELPDGGFGVWGQQGNNAPRRLISKGYIDPNGYDSFEAAQEALQRYVSFKRQDGPAQYYRWDILVNGKQVDWEEYYAMCRNELAVPPAQAAATLVSLANIEYRIATHMQGAYREFLAVGRCLNEAKEAELVPHGEWESWVRRNTGMSERQAQKLMQAARAVTPGSAMAQLPISKIQALLTLPEPEREDMAKVALSENLSLRQLQMEVRKQTQAAQAAEKEADKAREASRRIMKRREEDLEKANKIARKNEDLHDKIKQLELKLQGMHEIYERDVWAAKEQGGISEEAQAEIDRKGEEIAELEALLAEQSRLRQEAQEAMLRQESERARSGDMYAPSFDPERLALAVRTFLGVCGVLPHMAAVLKDRERQEMRPFVDQLAAWCEGAYKALDTAHIVAEGGVSA